MHKFRTPLLAAAGTAGLLALGLGPASAHVHVSPDSTAAGSSSRLAFDFSHGCSGSPTTKVTVTLPDELTDAVPTAHPGWDIEKVTEELAEPRTLPNGSSVTERTAQVVFTAKEPVADGVRDVLMLDVTLPDAEGSTLAFPVLQSCAEGESDWAEVPAEGRDASELDYPAPSLVVSEADDDDDDHGHGSSAAAAHDDDDEIERAETAGWIGLGAGAAGLIAGLAALALSLANRRRAAR